MRNQKGRIKIASILLLIILIILLILAFNMYKKNYFSGFEKGTADYLAATKFSRDSKIKYSEEKSFKIENSDFSDAAFYKEIEVEPNTPYKITCMVKTENIECKDINKDGGLTIGVLDTTQYSYPIQGTNDWQPIEFIFNSYNKTSLKVSFRLGGNENECKGIAWFSDIKLEKGISNKDSEWNIACIIIDEIDVEIEGTRYNLFTNNEDIENVKLNLNRFSEDCYKYSNKIMTANCDLYHLETPLTTISYSEEHGYYISYNDIEKYLYNQMKEKEYDHIFVVCRMENEDGTLKIPIKENWIDLGGMDIHGIGYSLIRINSNSNKYTYKFGITNQMPEEVFLHEFLHTLERNTMESGYEIPELHDYELYGYSEKSAESLMIWYKDYMQGKIYDEKTGEYIGLNETSYYTQPFNNDNFKYSVEITLYEDPENLFEEVQTIFKILKQNFS